MMRKWKFSKNLAIAAIEFVRVCREELGEELGPDRANAMMDAFDPELRGQVLFTLLTGDIGAVTITRQADAFEVKKIWAIKAVRNITGWGLKDAKDFVDDLVPGKSKTLLGGYSIEQIRVLREALLGTGYTLR